MSESFPCYFLGMSSRDMKRSGAGGVWARKGGLRELGVMARLCRGPVRGEEARSSMDEKATGEVFCSEGDTTSLQR